MTTNPDPRPALKTIGRGCYAVRIRKLNRTVTRIYDAALRPLGLTVGQLNLLVTVGNFGEVDPGTVSEVLDVEKSTLSRNLGLLEDKGWVRVGPGVNQRNHRLSLTSKGEGMVEKALPYWEEAQREVEAMLDGEHVGSLMAVLEGHPATRVGARS